MEYFVHIDLLNQMAPLLVLQQLISLVSNTPSKKLYRERGSDQGIIGVSYTA